MQRAALLLLTQGREGVCHSCPVLAVPSCCEHTELSCQIRNNGSAEHRDEGTNQVAIATGNNDQHPQMVVSFHLGEIDAQDVQTMNTCRTQVLLDNNRHLTLAMHSTQETSLLSTTPPGRCRRGRCTMAAATSSLGWGARR